MTRLCYVLQTQALPLNHLPSTSWEHLLGLFQPLVFPSHRVAGFTGVSVCMCLHLSHTSFTSQRCFLHTVHTHLVQAVTVPRLCNELGVAQDWVLTDCVNERRVRQGGACGLAGTCEVRVEGRVQTALRPDTCDLGGGLKGVCLCAGPHL